MSMLKEAAVDISSLIATTCIDKHKIDYFSSSSTHKATVD